MKVEEGARANAPVLIAEAVFLIWLPCPRMLACLSFRSRRFPSGRTGEWAYNSSRCRKRRRSLRWRRATEARSYVRNQTRIAPWRRWTRNSSRCISGNVHSAAGSPTSACAPIGLEAENNRTFPVLPSQGIRAKAVTICRCASFPAPSGRWQSRRQFSRSRPSPISWGRRCRNRSPASILGPYALLAIAVALAWGFNRGRAFVIAASLLCAFAAQQLYPGEVVHGARLPVPFNALLALVLPEQGRALPRGYVWVLLLVCEGR